MAVSQITPTPTSTPTLSSKLEDLSVSITELSSPPPKNLGPIPLALRLNALKEQLSSKASINLPSHPEFQEKVQRWSDYHCATPGAVVNVGCEEDIVATVKWATANSVPFLAQSGGHGFTTTVSNLTSQGILINLRNLNTVSVSLPTSTATIGGGAITREVLEAAHAASAHIMTGVCNSVGIVPALLGGGIGNQMSMFGLGVDNIVSARLVTATGEVVTVSKDEHAELFWGLRGAGVNFGIVSELVVRAHEQVNGGVHWTWLLGFPGTGEVVERVVDAVREMGIGARMGCTIVYARIPPTGFQPTLLLNLYYAGPASHATAAFAALFALDPILSTGGPTPYNEINNPNDHAGAKGNRKPVYSVSIPSLCPISFRKLWDAWEALTGEQAGMQASAVLVECYDYSKVREVDGAETAFPWRGNEVNVVASLEYADEGLDGAAEGFGGVFREILHGGGGKKNVYMNFAHGDEDVEVMYGGKERVERLRKLKREWDAGGVFSLYNPIR